MSIVAESLPERIYESAFHPEFWGEILEDIAKLTGARFASLVMYAPRLQVLSHYNKPRQSLKNNKENQLFIDSVISDLRSSSLLNSGFFESDLSRGGLQQVHQRTRLAQEFAKQGIGPQVGAITDTESGSVMSLKFGRWIGEEAFCPRSTHLVRAIYPAYVQALRFSSLLQFNRAKGAVDTLSALKLPAAVVCPDGHILHQNEIFGLADEYFCKSFTGKLGIRGSDLQKRGFSDVLNAAKCKSITFSVPADTQRGAALVHFIPVRRSATDIFVFPCSIMILDRIGRDQRLPDLNIIKELFNLTPAEAQLSRNLAAGLSLNAAATAQGITLGTARSYLHRVFSKTDTSQQGELISLIKSGLT
jgi:DNA-binding CsgD family transcriptional regulator